MSGASEWAGDLLPFAVALGIGLLVGFQRERTEDSVAGVRTFPLIALCGALAGRLAVRATGGAGWVLPAGLLALAGFVAMGNVARWRRQGAAVGITTEVATLVVFLLGALTATGNLGLVVILGGAVVVLLHAKAPMHGFAARLPEDEMRALVRIVLIGLVILPALPDRTYGPYEVLNPFRIWLMVVLIVGISVASYLTYRLVGARAGTVLGGVLGGLISSTATTASYARRAASDPAFARSGAVVVMVASAMVFGRIFAEVGAVAPGVLGAIAGPLGAMAAVTVAVSCAGLLLVGAGPVPPARHHDPTELRAALVFGALYGAVLFAVAAAKAHLGDAGMYGVSALSGLTDVDAITLSIANLAQQGRVAPELAWRAILLASLSNLVFKAGLALALGGRTMLRYVALLFVPCLVAGAAILLFWS